MEQVEILDGNITMKNSQKHTKYMSLHNQDSMGPKDQTGYIPLPMYVILTER